MDRHASTTSSYEAHRTSPKATQASHGSHLEQCCVGIWQHGQYLLCRDFLIVITHSANAFAIARFIVYLIIIVPHLQLQLSHTYNYNC
jgi:hypothetical protein